MIFIVALQNQDKISEFILRAKSSLDALSFVQHTKKGTVIAVQPTAFSEYVEVPEDWQCTYKRGNSDTSENIASPEEKA